ncbi:MAG: hypothetical protein NVSMB56_05970 [Pyrinomonadaceae bacterium]
MGILDIFRRKPSDDQATTQRAQLLRAGRIAEGMILDVMNDASEILYSYSANGVEYESAQILNAEQLARPHDYTPGSRVTVRFDPRRPGNSIVQ